MSRLHWYVFVFALVGVFSVPAQAACSWTNLTNGTPANATQVMDNFDCKAPLASPLFTSSAAIETTSTGAQALLTLIVPNAVNNASSLNFAMRNGGGSTPVAAVGTAYPANNSIELTFSTYGPGLGFTEHMRLGATGNLGIGTTAPPLTLSISGAGSGISLKDTNVANAEWWILPQTSNTTKLFRIYDPAAAVDRLDITAAGNVGIGTIAPVQKLDVAGTIRQTGCTSAALSANAFGDIVCTSDARLKDIRGAYTGGLDVISGIEPRGFTYKPTSKNAAETFVHVGFIAQNVRRVLPEASSVQRDGYYSLDNTAILAASVNAIKELKFTIETQAHEIRVLKSQIAGMKREGLLHSNAR